MFKTVALVVLEAKRAVPVGGSTAKASIQIKWATTVESASVEYGINSYVISFRFS